MHLPIHSIASHRRPIASHHVLSHRLAQANGLHGRRGHDDGHRDVLERDDNGVRRGGDDDAVRRVRHRH